MPVTEKQAFSFGFLTRCAQENLEDEQIAERVDAARQLLGQLEKQADTDWWSPGNLTQQLVANPFLYAVGGGIAAGGLGGMALAKMQQGSTDPDDVKQQELTSAYNAYTEQILQRNKLRKLRGGRGLPYPVR